MQLFLEGNYNHIVLRYRCQTPPPNALRTWDSKVQEGEPLEGYGTNSVLSRTKAGTILKFIKELNTWTPLRRLEEQSLRGLVDLVLLLFWTANGRKLSSQAQDGEAVPRTYGPWPGGL